MASIQIRTRRREYYAFFRDKTGKRTSRNTHTRNKREALRLANQWEMEASAGNKSFTSVPDDLHFEGSQTWTKTTARWAQEYPLPQSATFSSGGKGRQIGWTASSFKPPILSQSEAGDSGMSGPETQPVPNARSSSLGRLTALKQILEKRRPALKEAIERAAADAEQQAMEEAMLRQIGFTDVEPQPSTVEEHRELLARVWADFVSRKEPGAWGEMWVDDLDNICGRRISEMEVHKSIPTWPVEKLHPGAVLVVLRWDISNLSEAREEIETDSAASAIGMLEGQVFKNGMPAEDDPRIMDGPFASLDQMEKEAGHVLSSTDDSSDDHHPQREIAGEVIALVDRARQKFGSALPTELTPGAAASCAAWLHLLGLCMHVAARAEEMHSVSPRSAEKKAASARRLVQTQNQGGHQNVERQRLIEDLADYHKANPGKPLAFALRKLGIKQNPETNLFQVRSLGERKHSALREMWTEARKLVKGKKNSESGPTPNSES